MVYTVICNEFRSIAQKLLLDCYYEDDFDGAKTKLGGGGKIMLVTMTNSNELKIRCSVNLRAACARHIIVFRPEVRARKRVNAV